MSKKARLNPQAGVIELPGLSRPFKLGMLYDCRSDNLVPGVTLWDHKDLEQHVSETIEPSCHYCYIQGDSLEAKSSKLNLGGSIKLSILSGLIELGGSARYFKEQSTTSKVSRVSFVYSATTRHKQLTMEHLAVDKIRHRGVFDHGLATHVVVGIQYGMNIVFTFERKLKQEEDKNKIEGQIEGTLKKSVSKYIGELSGSGDLTSDESAEEKMENLTCTYIGDMNLANVPSNFEEAKSAIGEFQDKLNKGEYGVPMKVCLYPLHVLDAAAPTSQLEIGDDTIYKVQNYYQFLKDIDAWSQDTIEDLPDKCIFKILKQRLETFHRSLVNHKCEFQNHIKSLIQSIRGGEEKEGNLLDFIMEHSSAPYSERLLSAWKDSVIGELEILKRLTRKLNSPIEGKSVIQGMQLGDDKILTLHISFPATDEFLKHLNKPDKEHASNIHQEDSPNIDISNIHDSISEFTKYEKVMNDLGLQCVVTSESSDGKEIRSRLVYYKHGKEASLESLKTNLELLNQKVSQKNEEEEAHLSEIMGLRGRTTALRQEILRSKCHLNKTEASDNDKLIDTLVEDGSIKSAVIEKVFRSVDRDHYYQTVDKALASKKRGPYKNGNIHMSAPNIYAAVMEALKLGPGMNFLNLGSGTGYLSTLAGLILGRNDKNHGIEFHKDVVDFAYKRLNNFKKNSIAYDEFEFCEPMFIIGNALSIKTTVTFYDRVYCGAACPSQYEGYMKGIIKVGGILLMPYNDQFLLIRRTSESSWESDSLLSVKFGELIRPDASSISLDLNDDLFARRNLSSQ